MGGFQIALCALCEGNENSSHIVVTTKFFFSGVAQMRDVQKQRVLKLAKSIKNFE